jgi:hypothetical protein
VRANKTSFLSQYQQYSLLILLGSITGCQSVGDRTSIVASDTSDIANVAKSASVSPDVMQVGFDQLVTEEVEQLTVPAMEQGFGTFGEARKALAEIEGLLVKNES